MPNYRRRFMPHATYFLTIVTYRRAQLFKHTFAREILRKAIDLCQTRYPFEIPAIVLLPDHFHLMIHLPDGDVNYPMRMGFIKKEFTKEYLAFGGMEKETTMGQKRQGRRGVLQPRYYEHTVESETDYENHFHYIHFNPVKHGLVQHVYEWPYSSFHRYVKAGVYSKLWACGPELIKKFDAIGKKAGE